MGDIFAVRSDVIHVGHDDCGTPLEALSFYVVREAPDGSRWAHEGHWVNGQKFQHPEGGDVFVRDEGQAEAKAEALRARCERHQAAGGEFDADRWNEIDPAYGSEAYQGLDRLSFFRDREKMEDEERAWGWR